MYSAYNLNKQGDNIQPWHAPFPIWNQSVVPCPVLTVASWPAYRFLKRQVRWSGIPISWRISTVYCGPPHKYPSDVQIHGEHSEEKYNWVTTLNWSSQHSSYLCHIDLPEYALLECYSSLIQQQKLQKWMLKTLYSFCSFSLISCEILPFEFFLFIIKWQLIKILCFHRLYACVYTYAHTCVYTLLERMEVYKMKFIHSHAHSNNRN